MALDKKYEVKHASLLRDSRPLLTRLADWCEQSNNAFAVLLLMSFSFHFSSGLMEWADLSLLCAILFVLWLKARDRSLVFRMPLGSKFKEKKGG
jgi:hypothetical protein